MLANCLLDIDSVTCSNSEKGIPLPWEGTNFVITLESGAIVSSRLHHATRYLTLCYETMMLIAVGIYVMTDLCFGEPHFQLFFQFYKSNSQYAEPCNVNSHNRRVNYFRWCLSTCRCHLFYPRDRQTGPRLFARQRNLLVFFTCAG